MIKSKLFTCVLIFNHHVSSFLMFKSPRFNTFHHLSPFLMVYFPCLDGTFTRKIPSCRKCICGRCRWLDNLGVDQISTKLAFQCVWTTKNHGNLTIHSWNSGRKCRNRAGFSPFFQPSEICPAPMLHDSAFDPRMRLATELFLGDESFENDEEFAIWLYMVIYG